MKTGRAIPPSPPSTPLIKVEILRAVKRPRSLAKSAIPAHGPRFYGPLARENKSNGRPSLNRNCGEEEDGKRREKGGEAVIYICRYRLSKNPTRVWRRVTFNVSSISYGGWNSLPVTVVRFLSWTPCYCIICCIITRGNEVSF